MRFPTIAIVLTTALALSGCVSIKKQSLSQDARGGLKEQTVAATKRAKPDFAAMTATKGAFALLGAMAAISDGNSMVAKYNIDDPADAISRELMGALKETHGMRPAEDAMSISTDDAGQIAAAAQGKAAYVVDVQTINWSFLYYPMSWGRYRVIYTARVRLINAGSKTVVAEGFCKRMPDDEAHAPSYDDLVNDNAAGLKKELAIATQECITAMKAEMLAI